jgi:hypothetical protein
MSHTTSCQLDKASDVASLSAVAVLARQLCHVYIAAYQYGRLNTVLEHGIEQSLLGKRVLSPRLGSITIWKALSMNLKAIHYNVD